jgi:hypothetical protein
MRIDSMGPRLALLSLLVLPLGAGCGGDDDNGGGTGPTPNQNIPREVAVLQAEGAVDLATGLIATIRDLATISSEEDFSGFGSRFFLFKRAAEPVETLEYTSGVWNYTFAEEISEGDLSFSVDLDVQLGFVDAMQMAQPFPDETTASMGYGVDADLGFSSSVTDPDTEETSSLSVLQNFAANVVVDDFLADDYAVGGTGSQAIDIASTSGENSFDYVIETDWAIDVAVPQDGDCPSGTIEMSFGPYLIVVDFDGSSTAAWSILDGGVIFESGTQLIDCGPPARTVR